MENGREGQKLRREEVMKVMILLENSCMPLHKTFIFPRFHFHKVMIDH